RPTHRRSHLPRRPSTVATVPPPARLGGPPAHESPIHDKTPPRTPLPTPAAMPTHRAAGRTRPPPATTIPPALPRAACLRSAKSTGGPGIWRRRPTPNQGTRAAAPPKATG